MIRGSAQRPGRVLVDAVVPVWGIVIVTVAVSVIWALTAHGRDIVAE